MGLFDSVIGSVLNHDQPPAGPGAAGGGLGALVGLVAANPQLVQAVLGLLSNDGAHGGLGGLIEKFQQAGLGGAMASWIGGGPNEAVSGAQVTDALGHGTVADIAAKIGVDPSTAASELSSLLPSLINHLTPEGSAPSGGLGGSGDLMGMLGGLLKR